MATPAGILLAYRFVLFVLFVICNAIICSVAVWNRSMPGVTGRDAQISGYLIFVGAFGVVFMIPTAAVDLFRKNAVSSRVWFECLWVGMFCLLELAGASAVTASMSHLSCSAAAGNMAVCTSSLVLLAFTWLITILLLVYLLGLTLSAVLHHEEGVAVWQSGVRFFPWYKTRASLNSAPASPTRQGKKPLQLASARPQATRQATLAQPEKLTARDRAAPRAQPAYEPSRPAPQPQPLATLSPEPASLYPATLKSSLPRVSPPAASTPPPLGNWPRSQQGSPNAVSPQSSTASGPSPTARPRHPRSGSGGSIGRSRPVPPPLDLTRISAYRTIDDRVSRQ
ncbi:hypothetical protein PHLGIDRAFT_18593 [Phlebiopsis gigantea 11061_1 CR5-6]|uniref:MARVEL domain-containing protein n=1 Tax=Phlebiopsis gigantea (strain 11061_1 CR5-6) TaxID=745531 RepID=A0A0C3SAS0_PHLG1|nr:hypothetical protein PHLGIDRAFT_18593 [Phlebiopsis gigantea 11061_1 CR5-6]